MGMCQAGCFCRPISVQNRGNRKTTLKFLDKFKRYPITAQVYPGEMWEVASAEEGIFQHQLSKARR